MKRDWLCGSQMRLIERLVERQIALPLWNVICRQLRFWCSDRKHKYLRSIYLQFMWRDAWKHNCWIHHQDLGIWFIFISLVVCRNCMKQRKSQRSIKACLRHKASLKKWQKQHCLFFSGAAASCDLWQNQRVKSSQKKVQNREDSENHFGSEATFFYMSGWNSLTSLYIFSNGTWLFQASAITFG